MWGRRAFIIAILCARLCGCVELAKEPDPPGPDMSSSGVICAETGLHNVCQGRDQRKAEAGVK